MAVTQSWPLMILVTHWKCDLSTKFMKSERSFAGILDHARTGEPGESGPAAGLPGGYLSSGNVLEIDLSPVSDLSVALREALPGLLPVQEQTLIEHAGGNPRHLEQIIAFLRENEDFFEGFDTQNALTEDGLREAMEETHDIFKVVMRRLRDAPVDVQEAICIASLQGMQFVPGIVNDIAKSHLDAERADALTKAIDPFSMVSAQRSSSIAEFSERLFYLVAGKRRQSLKALSDTNQLTLVLEGILRERISKIDVEAVEEGDSAAMIFMLAAKIFGKSEPAVALDALSRTARLEYRRYSYSAALVAAERYHDILCNLGGDFAQIDGYPAMICAKMLNLYGKFDEAERISDHIVKASQKKLERYRSPENLYDLSVGLDALGEVYEARGYIERSKIYYNKSLDASREIFIIEKSDNNKRNLTVSLINCGRVAEDEGDLASALVCYNEAYLIRRELVEALETSDSFFDLSLVLARLGEVLEGLEDRFKAMGAHLNGVEAARKALDNTSEPKFLRNLAASLSNVGRVAEACGDEDLALSVSQESLEIARNLAARFPTPSSIRDLSISLQGLGSVAVGQKNFRMALALYQESLELRRSLASQLMTSRSFEELSMTLYDMVMICAFQKNSENVGYYISESKKINSNLNGKSREDAEFRINKIESFLKKGVL